MGLGLLVEEAAADVDFAAAVLDAGLAEDEAADRIRQLPPEQS